MKQTTLAPSISQALHQTELLGMLHSLTHEIGTEMVNYETRGDLEASDRCSDLFDATMNLIEYLQHEITT